MKPSEVTYTIECLPEDLPIKGNVLASGDDALDRETELQVQEDLQSGNEWAWCTVKVTAEWRGFEASDYLGGCSYESESDFRGCAYFEEMKASALDELKREVESIEARIHGGAVMKGYFSVLIPFVPKLFATEWHPTNASGPFATLSRGTFGTETEAIAWAKDHLQGTPYQVVYFLLPTTPPAGGTGA